jgi:uncharacterized repeat protein (TIGR01451 family)/CSLREA domain-containing protein
MRPEPLPTRFEYTSAKKAMSSLRRKRRLTYETLESRRQLAAFIVDTFTDNATGICGVDGAGNNRCSLRSAIIAANNLAGADTITLPAGTYNLTLPGNGIGVDNTGDLDITDSLTIDGGTEPIGTIIDAGQIDRVFDISGGNVLLRGLTIQNGLSPVGPSGGAIDSQANRLEIQNSIIQNNRAQGGALNTDGDGGAIAAEGTLIIQNSTLRNNEAGGGGGAIYFFGNAGAGTVSISDSTLEANASTARGGGALFAEEANVTIANTRVVSNRSSQTGGGLDLEGNFANVAVTLTNVSLEDNQATLSGAGAYINLVGSVTQTGGRYQNNVSQESGGGLYLLDTGPATFDGVVFSNNESLTGGGGAAILTDATFRNALFQTNLVTGAGIQDPFRFDLGGGAIAIAQDADIRPTVRIEDSSILGNSAALAGGIGSANANLVIVDSTIEGNQSTGSIGGAGGIGFAQADVNGVAGNRVRMTISNSVINNNTAAAEGGGIGIADADATLTATSVSNNTASGGRGGGIGIIGLNNSPVLRLNQTTLHDNSASGDGGGVAVANAGFFFSNTTISDNVAVGNGGGIAYANADTTVSGGIEFSTIASNRGQFGSNVAVNGSVTRFLSTIVADPLGVAPIINMVSGGPGELSSQGFNLFANANFSNPSASDLLGVDPVLDSLTDNGGSVKTRALLTGSPAIDAGANAPLLVDARGFTRPVDGDGNGNARNDIGAFEAEGATVGSFSITGVAFVDADANGFDADDQRLNGVQIQLFRDSGDGVFAGDDTLVDSTSTTISPVSGGYIFLNVASGKYFVVQEAVTDPPDLSPPSPVFIDLTADATADLPNLPSSVVAQPDSVTVNEDTPINVAVLANDTTGSGTLRILSTTAPTNGVVSIVGNQVRYVPNANFFGTDSFTYTITNASLGSSGATAFATVSINVSSVNDSPVAADDTLSASNQTPLFVSAATLLANDNAGPANEPQALSITAVSQPANGSVALTATGVTYTPEPAFVGTTSFTYTVADSGGRTDTGTVTVNVAGAGANADLSASLFSPLAIRTGTSFTYTGSVFNSGPATASSVVATITLPSAVTFVSATSGTGASTVVGNVVRIAIPQIEPQTSATFAIAVTATSATSGTPAQAVVSVTSATPDSVVTNNSASSATIITNIHRLTTGAGEGDVTIDVDSTGAFGTNGLGISNLRSIYNPPGTVPAADTVFDSRLGIRSTSGVYESIQSTDPDLTLLTQVSGSATSATSRFSVGPYVVTLLQTVAPTLASNGDRLGAQLIQTYSIQNTSNRTQDLGAVRYIDADLLFDGSINDGGGALIGPDGNMILFETDRGGSGATDTTFVGISNSGGSPKLFGIL